MARQLVDEVGSDGCFLEPQCGTGNLIASLIDTGVRENQIVGVERHFDLMNHTRERFNVKLYHSCFLEFSCESELKYDGIVSNPPFKKVLAHMKAAVSMLKKGGVLIAIVPTTFDQAGYQTLRHFDGETFEATKVHTKVVKYVM
jgi:trans-aconitate methyltransferase